MEFIDNEATCNTSPVTKRTFSMVLKTHTPHYVLCIQSMQYNVSIFIGIKGQLMPVHVLVIYVI
jgi:hypothetical protein